MKKILLTCFITLLCQISLLASCSSCQQKQEHMNAPSSNTQNLKSCICPKDFNPVCGSDHLTYSNACSAGCAGVKILHQGPCPTETSNP